VKVSRPFVVRAPNKMILKVLRRLAVLICTVCGESLAVRMFPCKETSLRGRATCRPSSPATPYSEPLHLILLGALKSYCTETVLRLERHPVAVLRYLHFPAQRFINTVMSLVRLQWLLELGRREGLQCHYRILSDAAMAQVGMRQYTASSDAGSNGRFSQFFSRKGL
jgi:hypothetical protein